MGPGFFALPLSTHNDGAAVVNVIAAVGDRFQEGEGWNRVFNSDCEFSIENQWGVEVGVAWGGEGERRGRKPSFLIL